MGAGGRDLERVTDRSPCPACGRRKLCRVTTDGAEAWCSREPDGAAYIMSNALGDVYVHRLDGTTRPRAARAYAAPAAGDGVERASPDDRHAVYSFTVAALALADAHRNALLGRGPDGDTIARAQYRTLPERGRAALARAIVDRYGVDLARRVPGIVWRTDDTDPSRGWWSFAGPAGIVIPCRDLAGRIRALKVRRDDPGEGARYCYVTSSRGGGPIAEPVAHVPLGAIDLRASGLPLVVTEGPLKADVATALARRPVIGLPGVDVWPLAVDLARQWGARSVVVAFDADAATNPAVARAQRALLAALRDDGFDARLWQWPLSAGKGLDDLLLSARRRVANAARFPHPETPRT